MKLSIKYILLFLVIGFTFALLIFNNKIITEDVASNDNLRSLSKTYAKIGESNYELYVVDTFKDMQKGLARFDRIEKDQGMLFIFETPGRYSFFMKDMKFDIDIIFLNETAKVISIFENVKKDSYRTPNDYESYKPNEPAKYVIELNAGEIMKNRIKIGDRVNFSIPSKMLK